ncbi:bicyclomycin resistance protein [Paenibacillus sp. HMSSN-139]|nr:bicyclomycin resistance protein [Paenibacillus sp. HMSSN-139]
MKKKLGLAHREGLVGYLFLSPVFAFYAIFLVIPFFFSFFLSFTEWGGFDLASIKWVGLANYRLLFSPESNFLHPVLTNTFTFAFGTVAVSFLCALAVAYFITRLRWEGLWRTLYFLPSVTTVVAIGNIWLYLYNPTNGLINDLFTWVGLPRQNFLQDPNTALTSVIVVGGWLGIGSSMLILSAGLKAIPEDFYEAADLEGGSLWNVFVGITLPLLKPSITFVLITSFIGGLQSFTLTMVMTRTGGPGDATNVAGLEMYKQAFSFGNWGLASAMAFVLFVCIMIITAIQMRFFKRGGVESY